MNRRDFCTAGLALPLVGCGSGDNEMGQEFTLVPSPLMRSNKQVFEWGVEGTWTPTLTFGTPGNVSVTYSIRSATYTKMGRTVRAAWTILTSGFTHTTAAGDLIVSGLPFTSRNEASASEAYVGSVAWQGITKASYTQVVPFVGPALAQISFYASGSGQSRALVEAADVPTGGTVLLTGQVFYSAIE